MHTFRWRGKDGKIITCLEKRKMLDENMAEIQQFCCDALDDALLVGCSRVAFVEALREMADNLEPTVKERA